MMKEKALIGKRIQELRKSKGFSQERIAEIADISPTYLSRIECGKENPTLDLFIKLSRALDVEMWEMFDFGHVVSHKELKETLQDFSKSADESTLRLASKLIRAVSR